ncbi:MAG: hypothetical protein RLZZ118_1530, partial [Bacteroidota bacterium]
SLQVSFTQEELANRIAVNIGKIIFFIIYYKLKGEIIKF